MEPHCPTCICGKRAPVQMSYGSEGPGTISWEEHEEAWSKYAARGNGGQSAQRIAERGGFSYNELVDLLGCRPKTWRAR